MVKINNASSLRILYTNTIFFMTDVSSLSYKTFISEANYSLCECIFGQYPLISSGGMVSSLTTSHYYDHYVCYIGMLYPVFTIRFYLS